MSTLTGRASIALAAMTLLWVTACADTSDGADSISVVASTTILGDVVANLVGSEGQVEVLMPVGADPHDFQLSSAQTASMAAADLVVVNGVGLEEGMSDVISSLEADGVNVLEVAPLVDPRTFQDRTSCEAGASGACDPHVWMDPIRMVEIVRAVEIELTAVAPEVDWSDAADRYVSELEGLHTQIESLLGAVPSESRNIVTNHDSLGYLADRYGLRVVGVVIPGGSTLGDPSSGDLAELISVVQSEDVNAIFAETSTPSALTDAVADELGEKVQVVELFTGSLGEPGTEAGTYIGMMRENAIAIADSLS